MTINWSLLTKKTGKTNHKYGSVANEATNPVKINFVVLILFFGILKIFLVRINKTGISIIRVITKENRKLNSYILTAHAENAFKETRNYLKYILVFYSGLAWSLVARNFF